MCYRVGGNSEQGVPEGVRHMVQIETYLAFDHHFIQSTTEIGDLRVICFYLLLEEVFHRLNIVALVIILETRVA